jgi:dTDP-D-glucose 4,6-dehydratase
MWADLTQIKKCLGWRPKVDLATGIATTTQWFAKRLEQDRIIGSDL